MESEVDERLQIIIDRIVRDGSFTDHEAIKQIKEVCNDARHSRDPRCVHWDEPGLCSCKMTGQEWYDRFVKELDKPVASDHLMCGRLVCVDHATAAAKEAAGIE